ncbi:hypothetical protein CPB86DRAFT_801558 [Serendipita vermifera]|nr:hypothetical protein CPB86DRAFT_801558 [Serendipita vermifera]
MSLCYITVLLPFLDPTVPNCKKPNTYKYHTGPWIGNNTDLPVKISLYHPTGSPQDQYAAFVIARLCSDGSDKKILQVEVTAWTPCVGDPSDCQDPALSESKGLPTSLLGVPHDPKVCTLKRGNSGDVRTLPQSTRMRNKKHEANETKPVRNIKAPVYDLAHRDKHDKTEPKPGNTNIRINTNQRTLGKGYRVELGLGDDKWGFGRRGGRA